MGISQIFGVLMQYPVAEVTCSITGGPTTAYNIWHFNMSDPFDVPQITAIGSGLVAYYQSLKALFASGSTITVGEKFLYLGTVPPVYVSYVPVSFASTGSSRNAANVAAVSSWRTASAGRSYRGRTYLGPLETTALDTNTGLLAAGVVAGIKTAGEALIAAGVTTSTNLVIYSRKLNSAATVIAAQVDTRPDSQRRRLG
jgi:hypothetical protein